MKNEEKNGIIIPKRQGNGYRIIFIIHNSQFLIQKERFYETT